MTDEPEAPPSEHTLDALRYMMARLHKPTPEQLPPTFITPEFAQALCKERLKMGGSSSGKTFSAMWRDEFILTDERMQTFGVDFGTKVAAVVMTWTPDGLKYQPITEQEFYATGTDIMDDSLPPLSNRQLSGIADKLAGEGLVTETLRKQREMIDKVRAELDKITGILPLGDEQP